MQINQNYERTISPKDLFFHLLYRWRSILLVAVIFAVAACAYQYLYTSRVHSEGKQTREERQYQIDSQNYEENLKSTRSVVRAYTKRLQEQNEYQNESIYIQLDAQGVWKAENKYLVIVDQSETGALSAEANASLSDSILSVYSAPLAEITDEQTLIDAFGTENTDYIGELVFTEIKPNEHTVTVTLRGASKEEVQKGMDCLNEKIFALAEGRAQEVKKHQLKLASANVYKAPDVELALAQDNLTKSMEANKEILHDARKTLDELEDQGEPKEPGLRLPRMAAIGLVVGGLLMLLIYIAGFMRGSKLTDEAELSGHYGIPVLGAPARSASVHQGRGLDKLIGKWELKNKEQDTDTIFNSVSAIIAEQPDIGTLCLVSTLPAETLAPVKEALAARSAQITVEARADFLHDSEAITAAGEADAVVVVEEKQTSRRKDIERMIEILTMTDAKVIGSIVL